MRKRAIYFLVVFFSIIGFLFCISLYLLLFFGETSNERRKIIFNTANSFVGIDKKFDGFIANSPSKIMKRFYFYFKGKLTKFEFDSINLEINLENLKKLEKLRKVKYESESENQVASPQQFVNARATLFNKESNLNEKLKIKLRPKGDRKIHFLNLDSMSYKLDIRGENKFIYGMEEMSIQKPVTRNFSWEILYHELLKDKGLLALNIVPIKLYRNSEYLGIFVIEEGFNKELIEKQFRKNGPIVGIDESLSHKFPSLKYEFYSQDYWISKNRDIYFKTEENLKNLKKEFLKEDFNLGNFFDVDKWAKFFAISDILKMFHGTVPKSVKLYYNPTTGLFEPIGFDGHYLSGYENFSFIDFIYDSNIECGYACEHKKWLSLFFSKKNKIFLDKYLRYLEDYSSDESLKEIKNIYESKIKKIDYFFYSEIQSSDRGFFKGILPYFFDLEVVLERAKNIRSKIPKVEIYLENFYIDSEEKNANRANSKIDLSKNIINIPSGLWTLENIQLKDKEIVLNQGALLILKGNNSIKGVNKVFSISGNGMIVQDSGNLIIDNVNFSNLKNKKIRGFNWSGAINVLNSNLKINNVIIDSNIGEDSINIVNSISDIKNLKVKSAQNDSIDIDFGRVVFNKITCEISGNDCLDISGAEVNGEKLVGNDIKDKLGSFGEDSVVNIDTIIGSNIGVGVVSKDSTEVKVKTLSLDNTNIHAASYNKKFFFKDSSLSVENYTTNSNNLYSEKFLISENNKIFINKKNLTNYSKNKEILKKIYFN